MVVILNLLPALTFLRSSGIKTLKQVQGDGWREDRTRHVVCSMRHIVCSMRHIVCSVRHIVILNLFQDTKRRLSVILKQVQDDAADVFSHSDDL